MGKKRLVVEAVLAATALPAPPPMAALLPDPTDTDLLPLDESWFQALLDRVAGADLYLQDEVSITLHPTLTRVWCRRGRTKTTSCWSTHPRTIRTSIASSGSGAPCVPL